MFTIYGKANCQSCEQATALLVFKELDFQYLSLGKDYDLSLFLNFNPSHRSFPMITKINSDGVEEYVGALEDLKAIIK